MNTHRSVLIRAYGGANVAEVAEIPKPEAGPGQVLVRVRAAGVNGIDWKVREGYVRNAFPLQLPAVLGIELAGVVETVGPGASRFKVGDRVMGPLGGLGAYADFVTVNEVNLSLTPQGSHRGLAKPAPRGSDPFRPANSDSRRGRWAGRLCSAVRQASRCRNLRHCGHRSRRVRAQSRRGPRHRLPDRTF